MTVIALGCSESKATRVFVQEVPRDGEVKTQSWAIEELPEHGPMSSAGGGLLSFSWIRDENDQGEVVFLCHATGRINGITVRLPKRSLFIWCE